MLVITPPQKASHWVINHRALLLSPGKRVQRSPKPQISRSVVRRSNRFRDTANILADKFQPSQFRVTGFDLLCRDWSGRGRTARNVIMLEQFWSDLHSVVQLIKKNRDITCRNVFVLSSYAGGLKYSCRRADDSCLV